LTRVELDDALVDLVLDLDESRVVLQNPGKLRRRVDGFIRELGRPLETYEVMFHVKFLETPGESIVLNDVTFQKLTLEVANEWEYGTINDLMKEMFDSAIGQSVGVVTVKAGNPEKAAERAQIKLDRALNVLRVQVASFRATRIWDRQLQQQRGQFRTIRRLGPKKTLVSTGGSQICTPISLELTGRLAESTKEGIRRLDPLYDGSISIRLRDAILRSIEWIGTSITRNNCDQEIVDLCTALEAVLAGRNDPKKGEAIALRSMLLSLSLGKSFFDPIPILQLYETRSRIIHGAELDICGRTECDWLRTVTEEVISNAIQLASSKDGLARPIQLFRHIGSAELLQGAISWLEDNAREPAQDILTYAQSKLAELVQAHSNAESC
jgi:hypothetical protein